MTAPAGAAAGVWTGRDTEGSNAVESGDLQNPLQCAKLQLLHSHRVDTLQGQQGLNLEKYELLESTSSIPSRNGLLGWPILLPSTILCLLQRDGNTNI